MNQGNDLKREKIRLLTFSTLYPSSVRPGHGIFVETRLRELVSSGKVESHVIAPVPWFFSTAARFGEYAQMARTPLREVFNRVDVQHPRYLLPPRVGMTIAPLTLALGAVPAVKRLLDEGFDFDVIDAHYYYPDGVAAALLARHFNKPFTVTARGTDINLIANHAIPRKLIRWAANRACASIGVSTALTGAMRRLGLVDSKLVTMRNGVDLARFRLIPKLQAREGLRWSPVPTLISVGNLVKNKGHHIAIEAMMQLPNFHLVIVGDGPERQALEVLSSRLGLNSRVAFAGRIAQKDLPFYYSAADILILLSSREGWPNVLLESMACGTPVIATDVGGVAEIVTIDLVGRLLPTQSSDGLVAAVKDLWSCCPESSAIRAHAQRYSWQSTTDAQIGLFERIKNNHMNDHHA